MSLIVCVRCLSVLLESGLVEMVGLGWETQKGQAGSAVDGAGGRTCSLQSVGLNPTCLAAAGVLTAGLCCPCAPTPVLSPGVCPSLIAEADPDVSGECVSEPLHGFG